MIEKAAGSSIVKALLLVSVTVPSTSAGDLDLVVGPGVCAVGMAQAKNRCIRC